MYVTNYMTTPAVTVLPDALMSRVRSLVKENHFRHIPIVDANNVLLGMITDRDIRSAYPSTAVHDDNYARELEKIDNTKVKEVMSRDVVALNEFSTLDDALILLDAKKVGAMPVLNSDGTVIGIFSIRDLLQAYRRIFGLGERGGALVAVKPDGKPRPLTRISHILEEHKIHFSRLVRSKGKGNSDPETIYVRVNTMNIRAVHVALEEAGFTIEQLKPQS
nr:CBS domain-containing protein [Desulfobulbaceae bacterium]